MIELNPYLLAIPYVTIIPLASILEYMVKSHPKDLPQKSLVKKDHQKVFFYVKVRRIIGVILTVVCVLGAILGIFIIASRNDDAQDSMWKANFIISFVQDFLVTPLIYLLGQFIICKFVATSRYQKLSKKVQSFMYDRLINKNLLTLFISTNPRVLKLVTTGMTIVDLNSPQVLKPRRIRRSEFRVKRLYIDT